MNKKIEVVPYKQEWSQLFKEEAALIQTALTDNCVSVHHIGSTSVPGLAAKPIIDIVPVVKSIVQVDSYTEKMQELGYQAKGEYGILFRRFFSKPGFNVHVYEEGSPEIERHIKFRDWMREHPEEAKQYAELKSQLAIKYPTDILSYCLGKEDFVRQIDAKTGWRGNRIVEALTTREFEAYHKIRREQIFETIGVTYDEDHPSLKDKNHAHLVMYAESQIVSVAHIEFLSDFEAALRMLATDGPYQHQGYGRAMMFLLERWLRHKRVTFLKMHARPSSEMFYRKIGYTDYQFEDPHMRENYINLGKAL